jgi:Domain of unknown function (DUF4404)
MESENLRKQLASLHAELANAQQVDPKVRGLLVKVMEDIARLVAQPQAPASPLPDASVADRLESVAVQFEAGHPALAASVRRFLDLLVKAGL